MMIINIDQRQAGSQANTGLATPVGHLACLRSLRPQGMSDCLLTAFSSTQLVQASKTIGAYSSPLQIYTKPA